MIFTMKARRLILRTLLLILMLSPSGVRAFASRIVAHSCRIPAHLHQRHQSKAEVSSRRACFAVVGNHSPTQRMHRARGKRVNVQTAFMPAFKKKSLASHSVSRASLIALELGGPNIPRAPPLLSL